ncbi:rhodopsin-like [Dioscorea cayenensis subsp. rotundata]|uniref:Rhodopsin-like n=1 Tax=Dioscorea cayennensis subsp. rotundata TaxID=55577 RepID=A0AB40CAY5_DIOCR|nr:rhodopsin-like [Dioscorea cayenensis subsp. rotundata]
MSYTPPPPQGYPSKDGHPPPGYAQGYSAQGYPPSGYPPPSYGPPPGYPPQGYAPYPPPQYVQAPPPQRPTTGSSFCEGWVLPDSGDGSDSGRWPNRDPLRMDRVWIGLV